MTDPNTYIPRGEFAQFQQQVSRSFEDVHQLLAEQRAETRRDFGNVMAKIDTLTTKGTDWKAIAGVASVLLTLVGLIGSIVSFAIFSKVDATDQLANTRDQQILGRVQSIEQNTVPQLGRFWTRDDHFTFTQRELDRIEQQGRELQQRVRALELGGK